MTIKELKMKIEEQKEKNTKLYKSIPLPTHDDPLNKKADPILTQWREGSKILKSMIKELQALERRENNNTVNTKENKRVFVNGFGEATKREITCSTYEKSQKRDSKAILSFMGSR
jgi:FtsZ-binding cell division protein ZapB